MVCLTLDTYCDSFDTFFLGYIVRVFSLWEWVPTVGRRGKTLVFVLGRVDTEVT